MDFDEERKDRAAIHSKYADLEKDLATLKTEHVTTVQALSDQLDQQPLGSLRSLEGGECVAKNLYSVCVIIIIIIIIYFMCTVIKSN